MYANTKTSEGLWCLEQAKLILAKFPNAKEFIIETGYGPSGRAHLGTLVENIRAVMVSIALQELDTRPIKIICIADDLDGMRKIPANIFNKELLIPYLGMPLCEVPDPSGEYNSFAESNIATLKHMLDLWNLDTKIEMIRASNRYRSGEYNELLLKILRNHQKVLDVILPTLRPERRETYSPFMPICPETHKVLETGVVEYRDSTIIYRNHRGDLIETEVTNGKCKLQWKVDWGMRMSMIHYEMYGKDLMSSAKIGEEICNALQLEFPVTMMYEMFLNPDGARMSKSKGNSLLTPDTWGSIAPAGSLEHFVLQTPKRAKKLDATQIPTHVDEFLEACNSNRPDIKYINPQNIIKSDIQYKMLIELAIISKGSMEIVKGMLNKRNIENTPELLIQQACNYAQEIVLSNRILEPVHEEWARQGMCELCEYLSELKDISPEIIQSECYTIGKKYTTELSRWFKVLYKSIFGAEQGPRIGTFFAYAGQEASIELIKNALNRTDNTNS